MSTYEIDYTVTAYMCCSAEVEADSEKEAIELLKSDFDAQYDAYEIDYDDLEIEGISCIDDEDEDE